VIIGKGGKHIAESDALDHVFGYTIHNDLTAHDLRSRKSWIKLVRKDGSEEQLTYPGRWKNFDTFSPLGPWLVTPDEVPDPENLRMTAHLNDDLVQDGTTADFVFKVPQLNRIPCQRRTRWSQVTSSPPERFRPLRPGLWRAYICENTVDRSPARSTASAARSTRSSG
jgi:hypothetical protein